MREDIPWFRDLYHELVGHQSSALFKSGGGGQCGETPVFTFEVEFDIPITLESRFRVGIKW